LLLEEATIGDQGSEILDLQKKIERAEDWLTRAETKMANRLKRESERNLARERQAERKAENEALKVNMNELKERIDSLKAAEGVSCPLCGQELSTEHRESTLTQLEAEGKQKGDRFRANQAEAAELSRQITDLEDQIRTLVGAEDERVQYASEISLLTERMETLQRFAKEWRSAGMKRLKEVQRIVAAGKYAVDEQKKLARLDKQLEKLGYDVSAHDRARDKELELRAVEDEYTSLKSAKEVSKQIEGEIANLKSEITNRQAEIDTLQADYEAARANLEAAQAGAPDLDEEERELFRLREAENKARSELGGAQQRVDILDVQRDRRAAFEHECEDLQRQIGRHRTLERAFGKDGVPALLIEQALPQIEDKANELLERLSDGQMSIRFATQTEYKDKRRDDLRETLDIQISDSAGIRNYEMYSGGEAFRVNFAIRLALSKILAQRKGARLQTLVIDEGFGSQDTQGRQRLIEAINLVKHDFAKILVITHLDELKDAFPTRIEVHKTDRGSTIDVV
jgi:exonuclease SbcC